MASIQVIQISGGSSSCPQPFLANLPGHLSRSLERMTMETAFPADAILFTEGQRSQGVMVIVSGKVKLSTTGSDGRTLIVRIAGPGDALGVSATVAGRPNELTAETPVASGQSRHGISGR